MNEDDNLQRMFDAQREVDKKLAPAFDDVVTTWKILPDHQPPQHGQGATGSRVPTALFATALSIAILVVAWMTFAETDPSAGSGAELDRISETLLVRIRALDPEALPVNDQPEFDTTALEMVWPTGTDLLMPLNPIVSNPRYES